MHQSPRPFLVVLAISAAVLAAWTVPSPQDRQSDRDRAQIAGSVEELANELAATEQRLADAQVQLGSERLARSNLENEVDQLASELRSSQTEQYQAIVAAFADAASVACATLIDPAEQVSLSELAVQGAGCTNSGLVAIAANLADIPTLCGIVPARSAAEESEANCAVRYAHTRDVSVEVLTVTPNAGDGFTDMLTTDVDVNPGDTLDVSSYFRVTNDLVKTVGVGAHLWAFNADQPGSTPFRISPSTGDNVDPARHHMPIVLQTVYVVPDDWPPGDAMTIVFKADAHSTTAVGDLDVDANGNLIVRITRA